jgi:hypothetical protein
MTDADKWRTGYSQDSTLSPAVDILVPERAAFNPAEVAPIVTFRWVARDYVRNEREAQEPAREGRGTALRLGMLAPPLDPQRPPNPPSCQRRIAPGHETREIEFDSSQLIWYYLVIQFGCGGFWGVSGP